MIDLENMERLAKKADHLPWEVDGCNNIFTSHNSRTLVYAIYDRLEDEYIPSFADTTYIVAACNAVPELIQRIRELEEEADCLADSLACHNQNCDCGFDVKYWRNWAREKREKDEVADAR